jgi:hypothetical protein
VRSLPSMRMIRSAPADIEGKPPSADVRVL